MLSHTVWTQKNLTDKERIGELINNPFLVFKALDVQGEGLCFLIILISKTKVSITFQHQRDLLHH